MNRNPTKKKTIRRTVAFLLLAALMYLLLTQALILNNETDIRNIYGFEQEPKDTLDVVLIGASELYTGYSAPLAWRDYGFTSYPLAVAAAQSGLYSSMLAEALRRQKPKLVVVEVNGFLYDNQELDEAALHKWLDNIPWSVEKVRAIHRLVPAEQRSSFYVPMLKYHENWQSPRACRSILQQKYQMLTNGGSRMKAFYTVAKRISPGTAPEYKAQSLSADNEQLLRAFCAFCREQGLENVLFLRMPHRTELADAAVLDRVGAVVGECGYTFANFDKSFEAIGLDEYADFFDSEHLNAYGLEKFTAYFGQYLCENYELTGTHAPELSAEWDECAAFTQTVLETAKDAVDQNTGTSFSEFSMP